MLCENAQAVLEFNHASDRIAAAVEIDQCGDLASFTLNRTSRIEHPQRNRAMRPSYGGELDIADRGLLFGREVVPPEDFVVVTSFGVEVLVSTKVEVWM